MFAAYGFVFSHPDGGGVRVPPASWPAVRVEVLAAAPYPHAEPLVLSSSYVGMRFREGWLEVERGSSTLRAYGEDLAPHALVHPYLALPATALAHWSAAVPLHAGALVLPGGAVGVLAAKGGGKSTTMAAARQAGLPILTDDLLVLRNGMALAGPRSIDLRSEAARRFGGRPLGVIGGRARWRLDLQPVAPEVPLVALVELVWSDRPTVERLSAVERLDVLAASYALGSAVAPPAALLEVATLPMFRVGRPRELSAVGRALEFVTALAA